MAEDSKKVDEKTREKLIDLASATLSVAEVLEVLSSKDRFKIENLYGFGVILRRVSQDICKAIDVDEGKAGPPV